MHFTVAQTNLLVTKECEREADMRRDGNLSGNNNETVPKEDVAVATNVYI